MTGSTLPQSVTTVFHEYCNCCKYLKLEVKEESFTSDYHTWNEYIVSCEHYDACTRAHDESLSKAKELYFDYYRHHYGHDEDFMKYLNDHSVILTEEEVCRSE